MPTIKNRLSVFLPIALLVTLAGPVFGQSIEESIAQTKQDLEEARGRNLHLIAPTRLANAEKSLTEAEKQLAKGDKIDKIERNLDNARRELSQAQSVEEVGKIVLRDAIEARQDALVSSAPEFAGEEWASAEKAMVAVGNRIERGEGEKARRDADKAADLYRAAELQAIRVDLLGRVRQLRQDALAAKADKWAPATLARADGLLDEAEQVLLTDRYRQSDAKALAESAGETFEHATWIAESVALIDKDRQEFEKLILRHEDRLTPVAERLGITPHFSEGFGAVADDMLAAVNSLQADRADLQGTVDELQAQAAELARFKAEAEPLKEIQRKVEKVRAIYAPGEAEVLLSENRLVVHLFGMTFASGSALIEPENFALLTKVQRTLREFPDADAVIEGHTDSQGDRDLNQTLSQRRADAVLRYLLANMSRDPATLRAVGFGPSRPVADNNTAAGRAKNRRIDVVVSLERAR